MADKLGYIDGSNTERAVSTAFPLPVTSTGNFSPATSPAKAEDTTHVSGDIGEFILGVRNAAAPVTRTDNVTDYSPIMVDSEGKQVAGLYAPADFTWQAGVSTALNTSVLLKAAAGAGIRNYLTDIVISNTNAAANTVQFLDGAAAIGVPIQIPAGGTVVVNFSVPWRTTANTALNIQAGTALANMNVSAAGYIGI